MLALLLTTLLVPLDHANPAAGRAELYYEFGGAVDREKPFVFVIADGQQFYVRKGAAAGLQKDLFGDAVNVVAIVGRGATDAFIQRALDADGRPDWKKAWQLFNSSQWIEDIEAVRREVVGKNGTISLYGRSGGAYLAHQYLQRHGEHVARAFTTSPVQPCLNRQLAISIDDFWNELAPDTRTTLTRVLAKRPRDRQSILVALQRQHFFIPADRLAEERAALIRALDAGDEERFAAAKKEYQVDEIAELNAKPEGMAQRIRALEFFYPTGEFSKVGGEAVYPLLESQYTLLQPLLALVRDGAIPAPRCEQTSSHRVPAEILVVAARYDDAVDYRTSIALAASYPNAALFIADDNHVFTRMNEAGAMQQLQRTFLREGLRGAQFSERFRWRE